MVTQSPDLDAVFHALSSPVRRDFITRLCDSELSVSQLKASHAMSLAAASKHVKVLEDAGLVVRRVHGRHHLCRLSPEALDQATEWITYYQRHWTASLDRLSALIELDTPETEGS